MELGHHTRCGFCGCATAELLVADMYAVSAGFNLLFVNYFGNLKANSFECHENKGRAGHWGGIGGLTVPCSDTTYGYTCTPLCSLQVGIRMSPSTGP